MCSLLEAGVACPCAWTARVCRRIKGAFRSRVRTVRTLSQQLHRIARRKNEAGRLALEAAYGRLIAAAQRTGAHGRRVLAALRGRGDDPAALRLASRLDEDLPLLKRGIVQARRRVIQEDPVPSPEKLVSLFEPHAHFLMAVDIMLNITFPDCRRILCSTRLVAKHTRSFRKQFHSL